MTTSATRKPEMSQFPSTNVAPAHRCVQTDRLARFAQGRLPPPEIERIAGEVERCGRCQQALASLDDQPDVLLETLRQAADATGNTDSPQLEDLLVAAELAGVESLSQSVREPSPPVDDQPPARPRSIGPYRVLGRLGVGGMGTVYVAEHSRLKRRVALKILSEHRPADAGARARFEREMQAIGRLDHANIVRAVDAGEADGQPFLAMELLDGLDMAQLVKRDGPLPVYQACEIIRQASLGIDFAHRQGLLHRDVKPSNLLLTDAGQVKVLDLGLARFSEPADEDESSLTSASHVLGTGDYVAPEQGLDPRAADERSDVYSLGCTLFFLLTGQAPFASPERNTFAKKVMAHVQEPIPGAAALRREVSPPLDAIIHRALAKQPDDRFASAAEMAAALAPLCSSLAPQPPPRELRPPSAIDAPPRWSFNEVFSVAGAILLALLLGMVVGAYPWLAQSDPADVGQVSKPARPEDASTTGGDHQNTGNAAPSQEPIPLGWIYKEHAGGKRTPTAMLVHGQGFGCLSGVQGRFNGWAEKVQVGVGDNNVWGVSGAGVEFGVDVKAHGYGVETRDHPPLSIAINSYQWSLPSDAIRMLHKDEGLCVLTGIQGGLNAPEHFLGIELHDDGYYWLSGASNDKQASVHATGVLLSRQPNLAAEVQEHVWHAGDEPLKMISSDEGICFLSMIGGSWSKPGDAARVYIGEDGHWYLSGGEPETLAFARALSVRFHGQP